MKREFVSIPPLPPATVASRNDAWKPGLTATDGHALVGATYRSKARYEAIRDHYDTVMRDRGWQVVCEESLKDWGKDLGGRSREYRKADLHAALQFAGNSADYGWSYALDLTCGSRSDCK
jgi:hypothetical protein